MNYEKYKLADFLADPEFKNWVLYPKQNTQLFWEKWIEGHPEQKDTILSARELILTFQFQKAETVPTHEKDDLLKGILNQKKTTNNKQKGRFRSYYGIAASVLMLLAASFYYFHFIDPDTANTPVLISQIVKENPRGQKTRITLPDGSKVWLNSESRLEYPSEFGEKRTISLKGEAFFEVVKDIEKPFQVLSQGIITTALGTSFNISAFEGHNIEVGLVTGKILVETEEESTDSRVFVSPGEKVIYDISRHGLEVSTYDNLDFIKWTNRIIVFKKATFPEIKEKLERWYDVDIKAHNLNRAMTYTGEFKNESLERILERMAFVEKFSFEINSKEINIFFE
ncbi:DUF4974 domain-containing protein [Fulvivirgaceae bacterium BMA10]|uniref:DUF4974 domain-containing protein n=1 Tax=Splendidivirga corallicola TaxID=3051826 RepID=A0ABT8KN82_9BACT|nr:DUF4974 domain-containing protein [Fulvivirgaceae bacterium BMA10]